METSADLHIGIQYAVLRLANPDLTFEKIGQIHGVTKQAVEKQFKKALEYLKAYRPAQKRVGLTTQCPDCQKSKELVSHLRRELILSGVKNQLLGFFKQMVVKFFPRFKVTRLPPEEKKKILDALEKFREAGGLIKDFAKTIGKSPDTLTTWKQAYEKFGLSGLKDKTQRPKNFGHRVPLWIKKHLLLLFLQFPRWTPYQYHSYIRHNPTTNWYVSLPVIQKLKNMHHEHQEKEKIRIKKRWCFAPGTKAWTVDFTCLLKTENFKLQCLTVSDHRSRYLIQTALYLNTSTETVIGELEELFMKYGKPDIIKADNGPEFRIEMSENLKTLSVYLLNNPQYYGQFNGAHERIHRTMKTFIDQFEQQQSLNRLLIQIQEFQDQYNYQIPIDSLAGKTPSEIFFGDPSFVPDDAEVITPYQKDGELRMKFTNRDGNPARLSVPIITAQK